MTDNDRQEEIQPALVLQHPISRRTVLGGSVAAGLGIFGGAMMRGGVLAAPSGTGKAVRAVA